MINDSSLNSTDSLWYENKILFLILCFIPCDISLVCSYLIAISVTTSPEFIIMSWLSVSELVLCIFRVALDQSDKKKSLQNISWS